MSNPRPTNKCAPVLAVATLLAFAAAPAAGDDAGEQPLGAAVVIIETTDNDIELQVFVDGSPSWKRLEIFDPSEKKIFDLRTRRRMRQQGMSELFFASSPSAFPEDENGEIDPAGTLETVEAFLRRFPAGTYEMEARLAKGTLEGEAILTHAIPALPEILAPLPVDDEPPVVDRENVVIEWAPVTSRFIGNGPVEIVEYQVILDQVDPERDAPWIDGSTRRALINVPGSVTRLSVPAEFLAAASAYEFEILAIEVSGNSTISVGEFVTR